MLRAMKLLLDSFWRAAAYCLHPRVILLSLLPLAVMVVLASVIGYFYWHPIERDVEKCVHPSSVRLRRTGVQEPLKQLGCIWPGTALATSRHGGLNACSTWRLSFS